MIWSKKQQIKNIFACMVILAKPVRGTGHLNLHYTFEIVYWCETYYVCFVNRVFKAVVIWKNNLELASILAIAF